MNRGWLWTEISLIAAGAVFAAAADEIVDERAAIYGRYR